MRSIHQHPVIWFFVLAFGLSWLFNVPGLFVVGWPGFLPALANFGPAAAALIVVGIVDGREGARRLLAALFKWRVPIHTYLFVLIGPVVMTLTAIALYRLVRGGPGIPNIDLPAVGMMLSVIFLYILVGIWGEEVGWRGYALPTLQNRTHPLVATLILGVLWGLWHLPLFGIEGGVHQQMGLPYFIAATIGYAILYTWVYNSTDGSLLLISMLHAANNTTVSTAMLIFPPFIQDPLFSLAVLALFDGLVIVLVGPHLGKRSTSTTTSA